MKHFLSLASIAATALILAGCDRPPPTPKADKQNTVTISMTSDPDTLDPRLGRDLQSKSICNLLFEGLTRQNAEGITGAIAKSIEISPDKTQYTFHLRESFWSDGSPVTAFDFEYSWKKILTPGYPAPEADQLYVIKNARKVKEGTLPVESLQVQAKDAYTLSVTLENPTPYFLELTAMRTFFPVPARADQTNPDWAHSDTSLFKTNGPFRLAAWKHNDEVVLTKSENYWDQANVHVECISFPIIEPHTAYLMYSQGELDWAGSPLSTLPADALTELKNSGKLQSMPAAATQIFRFNVEAAPLNSKKIRQALTLAINRKELVDHVLKGNQIPATAFVAPMKGWQAFSYFDDHDTSKANRLLNEGLAELALKKEQMPPIKILYVAVERNQKIAEVVQQQWQKSLGIQVELEAVETKLFREKLNANQFMAACGNWFADASDPISFLELFKYKDRGTNNTQWENPAYQKLLDEALQENDEAKRLDMLAQAEKLLIDEAPIAPLFFFTLSYLKKEQLKGIRISELGVLDLKNARIDFSN